MRKTLLVLAFLPLAASAENFSGFWEGGGTLRDSRGAFQPCVSEQIRLEQTERELVVRSFDFYCGSVNIHDKGPTRFQVMGGGLYLDGRNVGFLFQDMMRVDYFDAEGRRFLYELRLDPGGGALYRDHLDWTGSYFTEIEGSLRRF